MNENTIYERKKTDIAKTDIGTGVQMSKYLHHNSLASQGNKTKINKTLCIFHRISCQKGPICHA